MKVDENHVAIFTIKNTDIPFLPVSQMASYFGYSVAVTDLNGDG